MGKAGKVLKTVMQSYGISQGKLAAAMGIGASNVYRWANEIRDPGSETVMKILDALEKLDPDAATEFRKLYMGNELEEDN
ncbi:helix-turn-helix domain-containing protein [Leptolyngbya boryana FACHB-1624]|nr:helix-turn-helix transcriptional regulator [Leptolyngbya sp. FACHB-1624]MBD1859703.1 helix-turn-helix transcriptional regulator [Leptolyngbya sp. FACHB-1624]